MNEESTEFEPIFVIGSGRSGTTLLYEILCLHNSVCWVSNISNRIPWLPWLVFFSKYSVLRKIKLFAPASESIHAYRFHGVENSFLSVSSPSKELGVEDSRKPNFSLDWYFRIHTGVCKKNRLVSKNTSNSMRLRYLYEKFPNAKFLHIYRHPCGVVSSLLNVPFWPNLKLWWHNNETPCELSKYGKSMADIAANHWVRQLEQIVQDREFIPVDQFYQVRYEDLVSDIEASLGGITEFLELEYQDSYLGKIHELGVSDSSTEKWKNILTKEEQNRVMAIAKRTLENI